MTARLATRVMKARRESLCPYCMRPVRLGSLIAKTTLGWLHAGCVITRMYAQDVPASRDLATTGRQVMTTQNSGIRCVPYGYDDRSTFIIYTDQADDQDLYDAETEWQADHVRTECLTPNEAADLIAKLVNALVEVARPAEPLIRRQPMIGPHSGA